MTTAVNKSVTTRRQRLKPKPLTRDNFAAFGDVIEVSDQAQHFSINRGYTERYHDLAKVDVAEQGGRPLISIFRATPLQQPIAPIVIDTMERHPLSSQAFIPLGENPYLVVVAPAGDFDRNAIEVFLAQSNQGVNYHRGTWHHFCLALNTVSDFLVVDRGGDGDNCDEVSLDVSLEIQL